MEQTKRRRIVWTVLFVLWLCFVWGHSLVPGDASTEESSRFVFLVRPFFELFGNHDEMLMTFVIRKLAHFSEYVVMMLLASGSVRCWMEGERTIKNALLAVWVAVPCIDEIIQLFVPGRDSRVHDVLIDMMGGAIGVLLYLWARKRAQRKPRR